MAQNPVYRTINNLNGLPSNTVYNILQDNIGFIWIAHDKGLSRYDGKTIVNFKSNISQGKAVSNLMNHKDTIWCQDFSGNFYYTQKDSLRRENKIKASGYHLFGIINNSNQMISANGDSISIFNLLNKQVFGLLSVPSQQKTIIFDYNGKSYIFNMGSIYNSDFPVHKESNIISNKSIFYVKNIKNKLYGFTKNEFPYAYNLLENKPPIRILKKGLFIQGIQVIDDELWICTSTGAYCFDENLNPKYNGFCFFEGINIGSIIKDREGNYWFGTLNKGIFLISNLNIRLYKVHDNSLTTVSYDSIKNQILVGTEKAEILSFTNEKHFIKKFTSQISHEILGINSTKHGIFFYGNEFSFLNHDFKRVWKKNIAVKDLTYINEQCFAVAFSNGALLVSKENKIIDLPKWLKISNGNWENQNCFFIPIDGSLRGRSVCFNSKDSTLYIATSKGVYYYAPQGQGKILLNGQPIYSTEIKCFNNEVFIATFGNGLLKIIDHEAISFLSEREGLFNNSIYHFEKNEHKFWLVEEGMLQCFNTKTHQFLNYNSSDGLPKAEIKDILIHQKKVYLATTEGLVLLDENEINKNTIAPKIIITGLKANGITLDYSDNIKLEPNQNNLDILFSVLSYRGEDNLSIRYNINDGEWFQIAKDIRTLSLSALSSNTYKIKFQVINEDGFTEKEALVFNFEIRSHWYEKWYFILLATVSLIGILYFNFQRRIKTINKHNALKEEKLRLEQEVHKSTLTSIKSQMNPHFLYNALNTIQAYIYTNDKENASIYLGKFSDLTRSILEMSSKETIPLSEEIRALQLYLDLEKLRFEDKLNYKITIDENIDKDWIHIPSMLIQPYVENAIKHGLLHKKDDRQLEIKFKCIENNLYVIIEDNGIGRKKAAELKAIKSQKHSSFAVNANQRRLDILNLGNKNQIVMQISDKHDTFGNAVGTCVELFIPFRN